jgi:hypothetical protein
MVDLLFGKLANVIRRIIQRLLIGSFLICKLIVGPSRIRLHEFIEGAALLGALNPTGVCFGQLSLLGFPPLGLSRWANLINGQDGVVHHGAWRFGGLTLLRHVQVVPRCWDGSLLALNALALGLRLELSVPTLLIGLHIVSNRL